MADDKYFEERRVLLDFFRTQINTEIEIIVGVVIALFSQGVATNYLPIKELQFPFIIFGGVFFSCLAVLQWWKMFWFARLWNMTLMTVPSSFESAYGQKISSKFDVETEISKLYLGVYEAYINTCNLTYAFFIFLSLRMRDQLPFCLFAAAFTFGFVGLASSLQPASLWSPALLVILVLSALGLVFMIARARTNTCSTSQVKRWLLPQDLKDLALTQRKS